MAVRLLGLTNLYPPLGYGYGAICADVMGELARRGHDVKVLCADGGDDESGLLDVRRSLAHVPGAWRRPMAGLRAERRTQHAVRVALAEGVDVVVAWHMRGIGKSALTFAHDAGLPVVYMLGDLWVAYERPGPPAAWRWWNALDQSSPYRWARRTLGSLGGLLGVDLRPPPIAEEGICVFASGWLQRRYSEEGFRPATSHVIANALGPAWFGQSRMNRSGSPGLVFVGRTDASKGADLAIRATAFVPGATLALVGGAERPVVDELKDLARELGVFDRIRFCGPLPREEAMRALAGADAMLMPGRVAEAFGLVYLEAMAVGTPVVGTATGGASEFCADGENMLLAGEDPGEIAAAVQRILEEPGLGKRLIAGGRRTAAAHALGPMVDCLEALLTIVPGR